MSALAFGLVTAFGMTKIGIPSFIMTLAIMQIANGVSALLVRGQIAYIYPDFITYAGLEDGLPDSLGIDEAGKALFIPVGPSSSASSSSSSGISFSPTPALAAMFTWWVETARRRSIPASTSSSSSVR